MNVAIIGGRKFNDYDLVERTILDDFSTGDITNIVSGGAPGADTLAEKFANKYNIGVIVFKPDWKKYKMGAGMIRNKDIIKAADIVYAFWDGQSKGTLNSINNAIKTGTKLKVIRYGTTNIELF